MQLRFFSVGLSLVVGLGAARAELPKVGLKPVWEGLESTRPLWLETAPDGSGRLFCLEQGGAIIILPKDKNVAKPKREVFFDISERKPWRENEEGLLGMAFHPQFAANGKFYVYYSQQEPKRSVVSEFTVAKAHPNRADMESERVLLEFPQPYWNHNGGVILFGPDGKLYIASGDGGKANDPHDNAQNLSTCWARFSASMSIPAPASWRTASLRTTRLSGVRTTRAGRFGRTVCATSGA